MLCARSGCLLPESPMRLLKVIRSRPKAALFRLSPVKIQPKAKPRPASQVKAWLVKRWRRGLHLMTTTTKAASVAGRRNPHPRHPRAKQRKLKARPTKAPNLSWRRAKRESLLIGERSLQADDPQGCVFY